MQTSPMSGYFVLNVGNFGYYVMIGINMTGFSNAVDSKQLAWITSSGRPTPDWRDEVKRGSCHPAMRRLNTIMNGIGLLTQSFDNK